MLTIALPSPMVSVAISLISVFFELLLLRALKNLNTLYESALLKAHRALHIPSHVRRVHMLSFVPLLLFLVLEINYSTFSFPTRTKVARTEACVSVRPSALNTFDTHQFPPEARVVLGSCRTVERDVISVRIGNYSTQSDSRKVSCSADVYYKFRINHTRQLSTADSTLSCVKRFGFDICVRAKLQPLGANHTVLWLTDPMPRPSTMTQTLPFRRSDVLFPIAQQLHFVAARLAGLPSSNRVFWRADVLLHAVRARCVFVDDGTAATSVPSALAALLLASWGVSLGAFALSAALRRRAVYDVSNAFHVARNTRRASLHERYPLTHAAVRMTPHEHAGAQFVMCDCAPQPQRSHTHAARSKVCACFGTST